VRHARFTIRLASGLERFFQTMLRDEQLDGVQASDRTPLSTIN
jgi:hypothetical protein